MTEPAPKDPPGEPPKRLDPALKSAVKMVAVTAVVLTGGAALAQGLRSAMGAALGGALATANLWVFIKLGEAFLSKKGAGPGWGVIGFLKLLALFGAVYIILQRGDVSPVALVIGYGSLPIGITVSGLFGPKKEP